MEISLDSLSAFLNSSFFVAATTLVVGSVAFLVYRKQKIDEKRDAANIILMEIKNAETHLSRARESIFHDEVLPEMVFVMKASNWHKYSYLFVRDFADVEWGLINTFYEKCRLYDEALEYDNSFYKKHVDLVREKLQEALSHYTIKHLEDVDQLIINATGSDITDELKDLEDKHKLKLDAFAKRYRQQVWDSSSGYFYYPSKPFDDGKAIISTIKLDLSTSTIGIKLERIINQNFRSRLFERLMGPSIGAR